MDIEDSSSWVNNSKLKQAEPETGSTKSWKNFDRLRSRLCAKKITYLHDVLHRVEAEEMVSYLFTISEYFYHRIFPCTIHKNLLEKFNMISFNSDTIIQFGTILVDWCVFAAE